MENEKNVQAGGWIEIKKHYAINKCEFYDVVIHKSLKAHSRAKKVYYKIKFEEVKQLLAQGNFSPTPLSQRLFDRKFNVN